MTIKPDGWIRRMAHEGGMIEPFVGQQERAGVISYGVSSYGYDIRVADEFKIFTNVNSTVVDPKEFDPRSFVDFQGDTCLIPPNSFALARSVEYIRMPLNTLGVVLGKSTYARCFRGDTRVALVDGNAPTLEEMAARAQHGERFWGYSIGAEGQLLVTRLEQPRFIGRDGLVRVVLDNGAAIHCTPDHDFLRRNGEMVEAEALRPGDSLMPLYRDVVHGHEMAYQPLTGALYPTRRLAEEWNRRRDGYRTVPGSRPASEDGRRNDSPTYGGAPMLMPQRRESGAHERRNHRVVSVATVPGEHDVFCLTVPEAGNFALDAGVFVSNCGIITNFTPLEPGWEGHITIEISNTTPLPARIYANEGIAQLLFFESDEPCERSYADKKGKYQGQQGITLPRL